MIIRRFLLVVLGLLGCMALLPSLVGGGGGGHLTRGPRSAGAKGQLGLVLTLKELGFEPGLFESPPRDLVKSGAQLVVLSAIPTAAESGAFGGDLQGYERFVAGGGDLIVLLDRPADLHAAEELLGLKRYRDRFELGLYMGPREVSVAGEALQVAGDQDGDLWQFETELSQGPGLELLWSGQPWSRAAAAVILDRGLGRVVLLPIGPFENLRLPDGDHGLLFVRVLEHLGKTNGGFKQPLFDEWSLGATAATAWSTALFQWPLVPATGTLLLVALLWFWSSVARRQFPQMEPAEVGPPASNRAQGLANLLAHSGHSASQLDRERTHPS